jgi:succinate dehydrogenase/fumarate reductase flavoprotein subunit
MSGEPDVIVVGSGASALTAALAAAARGARVALLEKSEWIGGTSAISGGLLWIPNHPHLRAAGVDDSDADAISYLERLAMGRSDAALIETLVRSGPELVRGLEAETALAFETLDKPDYHPELPGARPRGRALAPNLFPGPRLGAWRERLRPGPSFSLPLTWRELDACNGVFHPERIDMDLVARRSREGWLGMGAALVAHLLHACLERGVEVELRARARRLVREGERVAGVVFERDGAAQTLRARRGVVLACGGFEANPELVRRFTAGPMTHPLGNPEAQGDGLCMALELGADLANMSDLWRFPAASIPGETFQGRTLHRMVSGERALPHSILVNRRGRRFVNEAHGYTDVGRAFAAWDPVAAEHANLPAWAIFDQQFREQYAVLGVMPGDATPSWLASAQTLEALARRVGIDPAGLCATVERFNRFAAQGIDPDFRRGESLFDRYYADHGREPSPTLGALEKPPFYALPVYCGAIGTSGGPRIDSDARVLHVAGRPIEGLYAAGDAAASTTGPGYGGPGGPIGQGMTMAWRAGRHAATRT